MPRYWMMWALGGLLLAGGTAAAQPAPDGGVSPYLNLLRRGNPAYLNYHGLVQPQMEFNRSLQSLQQQQADLSGDLNRVAAGGLPSTGHSVRFLNTGGYFGVGGRSFGGGGGSGSARAFGMAGRQGVPTGSSRPYFGTSSSLVAPVGPVGGGGFPGVNR